MNVAQLTAAIKDFLRPLAGEARSGERTEQLNNLGYVVIVFTVLGAGLGIEKVIAGNEFKNLKGQQRSTKVEYASERATGEFKEIRRALRDERTHHGCHAPDICARSPFGTENNFR